MRFRHLSSCQGLLFRLHISIPFYVSMWDVHAGNQTHTQMRFGMRFGMSWTCPRLTAALPRTTLTAPWTTATPLMTKVHRRSQVIEVVKVHLHCVHSCVILVLCTAITGSPRAAADIHNFLSQTSTGGRGKCRTCGIWGRRTWRSCFSTGRWPYS